MRAVEGRQTGGFEVSRDRFVSLQKRGRIEVRTPAAKKKRAIKLYEPEGRSDRLAEAQEALDRARRANEAAAAAAARG